MVVMPGGVDMHCHVASSSVNVARRLLPEDHGQHPATAPLLDDTAAVPRSGTDGTVPTTFTTGYRYAGLGYTTVFDAAVAPIMARTAHTQLDDTPIVDGGFFALLGNDDYLLRLIDAGDRERAREYAAWMLAAVGAYAIKIVNPAGVELWKRGMKERTDLDTALGSSRVTPRAILETRAIKALAAEGYVVVACGGGGIPVIEDETGDLRGVEAVIDKDLASSLLARSMEADILVLPTGVEKVALDFNKPTQRWLDRMTLAEARKHQADNQFDPGSMGPKIAALVDFVGGGGRMGLITDPPNLSRALRGETGTRLIAK